MCRVKTVWMKLNHGELRFSFEEKTSDLADNSVLVVSTRQRSMPHHGGLLVSCIDREIDCCPSLSGLPTLWGNFKSYVNLLTLGSMWQCELTTCRETTFAQPEQVEYEGLGSSFSHGCRWCQSPRLAAVSGLLWLLYDNVLYVICMSVHLYCMYMCMYYAGFTPIIDDVLFGYDILFIVDILTHMHRYVLCANDMGKQRPAWQEVESPTPAVEAGDDKPLQANFWRCKEVVTFQVGAALSRIQTIEDDGRSLLLCLSLSLCQASQSMPDLETVRAAQFGMQGYLSNFWVWCHCEMTARHERSGSMT